jgi:hypothetical protein
MMNEEAEQECTAAAGSGVFEEGPACAVSDLFSADAPEIRVRDYFAAHLGRMRPSERLVATEQRYRETGLRADMRSVDEQDCLREWEFKIHADYRAIGQILTYVGCARRELRFRPVRAVIAAFSFSPDVPITNETMNLSIELVTIPDWMRAAGGVPTRAAAAHPFSPLPQLSLQF